MKPNEEIAVSLGLCICDWPQCKSTMIAKVSTALDAAEARGHDQAQARIKELESILEEIYREALIGKAHGVMDASSIAFDCERTLGKTTTKDKP